MRPVLSNYTASITELKRSPSELIKNAGDEAVAILNHNTPSAYLVPSKTYEKLIGLVKEKELDHKVLSKEEILYRLRLLKPNYEKEGFKILALFGSSAKEIQTKNSDIDILYEIDDKRFLKKQSGFVSFSRLAEIKGELEDFFKTKVDICAKSGLSKTGEEYILKEAIYV